MFCPVVVEKGGGVRICALKCASPLASDARLLAPIVWRFREERAKVQAAQVARLKMAEKEGEALRLSQQKK